MSRVSCRRLFQILSDSTHIVFIRLKQSTYYKEKEEFEVTSTIRRIEDIRKNVNQIKNINTTLEQLVKQYEVSMDSSQRLSLQRRISTVIQNGNSIAAASRVLFIIIKHLVCYSNPQIGV